MSLVTPILKLLLEGSFLDFLIAIQICEVMELARLPLEDVLKIQNSDGLVRFLHL